MTEQKRKVFISHSSADLATARAVASALDAADVEYFLDTESLQPGEKLEDAILKALQEASVYVLLVSPTYVNSSWGQVETGVAVARAREKGVRVIPVMLKDAHVPSALVGFAGLDAARLAPSGVAQVVKRLVEEEGEDE